MKREFKIGLFLGIVLLILAVFVFIIGDLRRLFEEKGYPLRAQFDSTAGLEKGALVRMAGVKIGYVDDIRLSGIRAEVLMSIDPQFRIQKDAKATLASLGLLGAKYIEVIPGRDDQTCLEGEAIEGLSALGFDQIGSKLGEVGEDIRQAARVLTEAIGDEGSSGGLRQVLGDVSRLASELGKLLEENRDSLGRALQDSSRTVQNVDRKVEELTQDISELIAATKKTVDQSGGDVKENLERLKEIFSKLEDSLRILNQALEKVNSGQGTLGRLVQDPGLYERTESVLDDAQRVIDPLSAIRLDAGLSAAYYGDSRFLKSVLWLRFRLSERRYLQAQIVQDPWQDRFTYSLQGGLRWGWISTRGGILESKFGLGIDLYAFRDRLIVSVEGYDFNRDLRPRFRLWSRIRAAKALYFIVGVDDFSLASSREAFFGLGIGL